MDNLLIGSHISLKAPNYFLDSVKEALKYGETTFMFYTGAPQNSLRIPLDKLKIEEGLELLKENKIDPASLVVHAPYTINLGNIDEEKFDVAKKVLANEILRTAAFNVKYLVLHPGSHLNKGVEIGLDQVIRGLDEVLANIDNDVIICLELMAGKGAELGKNFEEIAYIINHSKFKERLGVCLDTCHINDSGYDVSNVDLILDEFDQVIGLDKLKVIHLNDSKNERFSHKDRHENIGFGTIGFDTLSKWVHCEKISKIPKILETPYVDEFPPYKKEIELLRKNEFDISSKEELKSI